MKFEIEIPGDDLKLALEKAIKEAKVIFGYKDGIGSVEPKVKLSKSKKDFVKAD